MVGGVYPAIPWWVVYTRLYHGGYMHPVYHGGYMHPCIPPGTPPPAHVLPVLYILLLMVYWCQTMRPWAQPGN